MKKYRQVKSKQPINAPKVSRKLPKGTKISEKESRKGSGKTSHSGTNS